MQRKFIFNNSKCNSNFGTKIHEALLIKKHNPGLARQLFVNDHRFC